MIDKPLKTFVMFFSLTLALGLTITALAALAGCPIRIDPPPPSSCLSQPNCGQCTSHSTTVSEGSTSLDSGRFCVWCETGSEGRGCYPEGHDCVGAVRRLEECSEE
ncbi:MAG: hypothetical protein HC882_01865 [Acidobacteria bacterium]|nr:hypothetical protein [Acidobacteriota bacterium]